MNLIGKEFIEVDKLDAMFNEAIPQTDQNGNIDYEGLIKVMLNEPEAYPGSGESKLSMLNNIKLWNCLKTFKGYNTVTIYL